MFISCMRSYFRIFKSLKKVKYESYHPSKIQEFLKTETGLEFDENKIE